jgi:hypothetical protein
MLYRIITENKLETIDVIHEAMTFHEIDGYTLIEARGYWKGTAENSMLLEIDADMCIATFHKICNIAKMIKLNLDQESVLVQRIESESLFL